MANTRYLVEWTPWADVLADAKRHGMPEGGEVNDYADPDDHHANRAFPSFGLAVAFARKVLPLDTWHSPRVRRQIWVQNDHDDLGNRAEPMPSYETEATWEVFDDMPNPVEAAPDWLDEAA